MCKLYLTYNNKGATDQQRRRDSVGVIWKKINFDPYLAPYTKNSIWIVHKHKTLNDKASRRTHKKISSWSWLGKNFL